MLLEFFSKIHHLDQLIAWGGYAGLAVIIFCETGLLFGFFLPGDSLLVTAGLVASQGKLDFWVLNLLLMAAAVLGDSTGYLIGYKLGPRVFKKENSLLFHRTHLERTHRFFERYGGKTIILARFVPIVRTFAPTVAGVGRMDYKKFLSFNVVGGIFWVLGMLFVGYFLGERIPNIEKHLNLVIGLVIFISFLPIFFEAFKARKKSMLKKVF